MATFGRTLTIKLHPERFSPRYADSAGQCDVIRVGMDALLNHRLWWRPGCVRIRSHVLQLSDTELQQHVSCGRAGLAHSLQQYSHGFAGGGPLLTAAARNRQLEQIHQQADVVLAKQSGELVNAWRYCRRRFLSDCLQPLYQG